MVPSFLRRVMQNLYLKSVYTTTLSGLERDICGHSTFLNVREISILSFACSDGNSLTPL